MKLKKQFKDYYTTIRIDSEAQVLKEKRTVLQEDIKTKFPGKMADHGIELKKTDIEFFDQGSYKYNTTIKAENGESVDRDVAVMIPLDITENGDPRKIKGYLRDAINISSRTVSIKEPCVSVGYYEDGTEWLHIDLPLYAKNGNNIYLARGKEFSPNYSWEPADPHGLNDYLCGKINGNAQLRRIICFIKKWRNIKYATSTSDHEVPPSIGLTLLACNHFCAQSTTDGDDDLLALQKTMKAIISQFSVTKDQNGNVTDTKLTCLLPVEPYADVFKKMKDSSNQYMITFYKRLSHAVDALTNAVNVESEHDAGVYVQKVLGEEFSVPAKESVAAVTRSRREHGFG